MRKLAFAAAAIALGASPLFACGATDKPAPPPQDAAPESQNQFDVAPPPPPDSGLPGPGDPCGDKSGLDPGAPWPMLGGCPKRSGYSSSSIGPANAVVKWTAAANAGANAAIVESGDLVWAGTSDGDVEALSPSGVVVSVLHGSGAVKSTGAVDKNGVLVIGGGDGVLYGIGRGTTFDDAGADAAPPDADVVYPARVVFSLPLGPIASSPAIGADGTIYVGTTDGKLAAVAGDGSKVKWRATTNDTSGASPSIAADGTIYVGSSDHHLYALDPAGNPKWSYDGGAALGTPAVGGDETVYVGGADGTLHAVTPDGKKKWTYAAGGAIAGVAVFAGAVYAGSADKSLHAVNVTDGAKAWTFPTLGAVATPAIAKDGKVFVGSADGHLYAITIKGSLYYAVNVKGGIAAAPALSDDGMLYVTTTNAIVAIGP